MTVGHYINGEVIHGGQSLPITSPWDGSEIGQLSLANQTVLEEAVTAANTAFQTWKSTPVKERVQPLFRFKSICESHVGELAAIVSRENGKLPAEAQAGIEKGLECVEFAASLPQLAPGELLEVSGGVDCHTRYEPIGVTAGITPFNFPAMVPLWMFPLAIACGNTFLLKPSEQTPMTAVRMAEMLYDSGLPEGVFNVIQGDRATVEAMLDHASIAAVTFVGSTPVAKSVYHRGIDSGKRVLALGGAKNHLVVVPDADAAITARNVVASATGCAGQRCMAASVLIAVGDCEPILDAIAQEMLKVVPGKNLGAIISLQARDRIRGYIDRAESEGAKIVIDGRQGNPVDGWFVGPTLIDGVDPTNPCAKDEIFGPVLIVLRVDTLDEALAIENASPFGNAASIYTTTGATARYFEQRANAGMIGINIGVPVPREPFSFGGWNGSKFGVGDITGKDGIRFWTKTKKVTSKWTAQQTGWMS